MNTQLIPTIETIKFKGRQIIKERIYTPGKAGYTLELLNINSGHISITIDYSKQTICIYGKVYQFSRNTTYIYKKTKGNKIEGECFIAFINHIKQSNEPGALFWSSTWHFLLGLTKKKFTQAN